MCRCDGVGLEQTGHHALQEQGRTQNDAKEGRILRLLLACCGYLIMACLVGNLHFLAVYIHVASLIREATRLV